MSKPSERERALILVNPRARGARSSRWQDRALSEIGARYAAEIVAPGSATEATQMARKAAAEGAAVAVAAGGDGTVNVVAQGLCGTATALGILPLGSANDLARELGIPRHDVGAAARLIATRRAQATDLGAVDGRVFCGVGGMNLVAGAALGVTQFKQRSARARRLADALGGSGYRISATAMLMGSRSLENDFHIEYADAAQEDRRALHSRAAALFVANHRTLGGGLVLPIDGSASDGMLEICLVPARSRVSLMLNFARLSSGRRLPPGVLQVVHTTEAVIETSRDDAFVADGELLATGRRFHFRVLPRSLNILAGPGDD